VTYSNLCLAEAISSTDHPFWRWLAKRSGRVAGLSLELSVEILDADATENAIQLPGWMQPLEILSGIQGVQLILTWVDVTGDQGHPCISQWLKQNGQLISHLMVEVHVSENRLKLSEFSEAAAPCRSVDLTIHHPSSQVVDLADLNCVAGSLQRLACQSSGMLGSIRGASAFTGMSQLTALKSYREDFQDEEPWGFLASLTKLQNLRVDVRASGDPSALTSLTGLSSLRLSSSGKFEEGRPTPFSFSNLQPLSTLGQLKDLCLAGHACAFTSLQGLAGLSKLKELTIESIGSENRRLRSLEGISPCVKVMYIVCAPDLVSLAGIESCTNLTNLFLVTLWL
jgi:hypothetical protein